MYTCRECGEEFERGEVQFVEDTGDYVCDNCRCEHDYYYCDNCNDLFSPDYSLNWDGDYCYCDNCYEERDAINGYHTAQNNGEFYIMLGEGEEDNDNLFKYGFELEVQGSDLNKVARYLRKYQFIADIEYDSSVSSGFEIISHPMTRKYINEHKEDIKSMLDYLIENGYKSHDTSCCGLHIHTTKSAYGDNEDKQNKNISKLMLFTEFYKNELKVFSRRTNYHYCEFTSDTTSMNKNYLKSSKILKSVNDNGNRYQVINNTNSNTVEFRVFRGTLNYNTFMATLMFVCELTEEVVNKNTRQISWDLIIENSKSEELKNYVANKEIFNSQKLNDECDNIDKIVKAKREKQAIIYDTYNKYLVDTINQIRDLQKTLIDTKMVLTDKVEDNKKLYTISQLNATLSGIISNNISYLKQVANVSDIDILNRCETSARQLAREYENLNDNLNYLSTNGLDEETKTKINELKSKIEENKQKIENEDTNNNNGGEE